MERAKNEQSFITREPMDSDWPYLMRVMAVLNDPVRLAKRRSVTKTHAAMTMGFTGGALALGVLAFLPAAHAWLKATHADTLGTDFVCVCILTGVVAAAVLAFVGFWEYRFARSLADELKFLTELAHRTAEGEYGVTVTKPRNDELGDLIDLGNTISQRLAENNMHGE